MPYGFVLCLCLSLCVAVAVAVPVSAFASPSGRKRDAEIAAKNAAIKRMEEEVQEELREEWQAKESRVADIHKKRAEHREAERRAREAEVGGCC